jgi:uncharacterized repeat protein (TIGR03843 family)
VTAPTPPFDRELGLLNHGELGIVAQLAESSNLAFVLEASDGGEDGDYGWAVYKPAVGERPLHDFARGLHGREEAAFRLSEYLGWHIVPPTVTRVDAPFGIGSLQWYIENEGMHYFPLLETRPDLHGQLRRLAVFDMLANNTDRKSGHVLLDAADHVWGIDHGLCFSAQPKLRTVIWDFAGEEIDAEMLTAVEPLIDEVPADVAELLAPDEVSALRSRASRIVRLPQLPHPRSHYHYPWPLV